VPADTPVTNPALVTLATPGVADTHGFTAAGAAEPVSAVVLPIHTLNAPVIVGSGLTVSVCVAVLPLLSVYVIVVDPADTVVITPPLSIVATPGLLDTHGVTAAGVPEPVNVIELPRHTLVGPVIVGRLVTVIVCVTVQPLLLVYVITLVPADTPVITPALVTVATAGVADTHGFTAAGTPEPVHVVLFPVVTLAAPTIVGSGFTVNVAVIEQPLLFVYVITLVPADTPVTTPALSTVATPGVADTQGLTAAGMPEPLNAEVLPIHAFKVPVMAGRAFTVTVAVMVQPLLFV